MNKRKSNTQGIIFNFVSNGYYIKVRQLNKK